MPLPVVFADSFYWVALIDPRDAAHAAVVSFSRQLQAAQLVTTDEVFMEVANYFSGADRFWRGQAALTIQKCRSHLNVVVLPQSRPGFDAALALYEARPDNGYSLTGYRLMAAMRDGGLTDVLTNDHHFTQEGFTVLFP